MEMILSVIDDQRSERRGECGPHKCAGVPMGIGGWAVDARLVLSKIDRQSILPDDNQNHTSNSPYLDLRRSHASL